jgi:5-methylcytosine-specific restriction endonuclease McrA
VCNSAKHNSRPNRESLSKRLGAVAIRIKSRDAWACVYCGTTELLSLDHLTPRSHGGLDTPSNLVTACRSCNSRRQNTALATWCRSIGLDSRAIRAQARRALPEVSRDC